MMKQVYKIYFHIFEPPNISADAFVLNLASIESAVLTVNHTDNSDFELAVAKEESQAESQEESLIASEIVENVLKSAASEIKCEEEADLESEILVQSDDEEVSISEHASAIGLQKYRKYKSL